MRQGFVLILTLVSLLFAVYSTTKQTIGKSRDYKTPVKYIYSCKMVMFTKLDIKKPMVQLSISLFREDPY